MKTVLNSFCLAEMVSNIHFKGLVNLRLEVDFSILLLQFTGSPAMRFIILLHAKLILKNHKSVDVFYLIIHGVVHVCPSKACFRLD